MNPSYPTPLGQGGRGRNTQKVRQSEKPKIPFTKNITPLLEKHRYKKMWINDVLRKL